MAEPILDEPIITVLPPEELEPLFDDQYYLRYVDDIFQRLGLTEIQWKKEWGTARTDDLAPKTM